MLHKYDSKTGKMFHVADGRGIGAAIQFTTLDTGLKLTATDFNLLA